MKSKYIVATLISMMILFTPLSVSAAEVGDTLTFSTGRLLVTDSQIDYTQIQRIDLGQTYSGDHFISLRLKSDLTFTPEYGSEYYNPSYIHYFTVIINGIEYYPQQDISDEFIRIDVNAKDVRYIGIKWNLTFWSNPTNIDTLEPSKVVSFENIMTLRDLEITPVTYTYNVFDSNLNQVTNNISNFLITWKGSLDNLLDSINSNISNSINNLSNNISDLFASLFDKIDDDQEEIINGYDPNTGDTADSDFNAGADELHNVENSLFQSASYDEVDYSQYNDFFSLTGVAGAMSFVASFFESLYAALGIYAVPFTIGLVLIIITRILGYQNFSAGGG